MTRRDHTWPNAVSFLSLSLSLMNSYVKLITKLKSTNYSLVEMNWVFRHRSPLDFVAQAKLERHVTKRSTKPIFIKKTASVITTLFGIPANPPPYDPGHSSFHTPSPIRNGLGPLLSCRILYLASLWIGTRPTPDSLVRHATLCPSPYKYTCNNLFSFLDSARCRR